LEKKHFKIEVAKAERHVYVLFSAHRAFLK
jgi:hypothetical protein